MRFQVSVVVLGLIGKSILPRGVLSREMISSPFAYHCRQNGDARSVTERNVKAEKGGCRVEAVRLALEQVAAG